jgi:hypothetical protein
MSNVIVLNPIADAALIASCKEAAVDYHYYGFDDEGTQSEAYIGEGYALVHNDTGEYKLYEE